MNYNTPLMADMAFLIRLFKYTSCTLLCFFAMNVNASNCQRGDNDTSYKTLLKEGKLAYNEELLEEAEIKFCQAAFATSDDRQWQKATLFLSYTLERRGNLCEAYQVINSAKNRYKRMGKVLPEKFTERLMQFENNTDNQSADYIKCILASGLNSKSFGVVPAINLPIHFESSSDQLTTDGRRVAQNLGEAIQNRDFSDFRFQLIGHTDRRGHEDYNQVLSERRSSTVYQYLGQLYSALKSRLCRPTGKGESDLRFTGNAEKDHKGNRRVEVVVVNECRYQ
jgi:outer membrane protein OmpA-like peptidoglycan-associated protein